MSLSPPRAQDEQRRGRSHRRDEQGSVLARRRASRWALVVVSVVGMLAATTIPAGAQAPPDDGGCPAGFFRLAGSAICVAETVVVRQTPPGRAPAGDDGCPEGFRPAPSGLFCFAEDTTAIFPVNEARSGDCPAGFVRPPGVRFCIAENTIAPLNPRGNGPDCPEGFQRAPSGRFCVAVDLTSPQQPNRGEPGGDDGCPERFVPVGRGLCVAEHLTIPFDPGALAPPGPCPEGFVQVRNFCIAANFTAQPGDPIPR